MQVQSEINNNIHVIQEIASVLIAKQKNKYSIMMEFWNDPMYFSKTDKGIQTKTLNLVICCFMQRTLSEPSYLHSIARNISGINILPDCLKSYENWN